MKVLINSFVLFFSAISLQAASYKVDIDYYHSGMKYTDTKSGITVRFLDTRGNRVHEESVAGIYPISQTARSFQVNTQQMVQSVQIVTSGEDAFFIDQVIIWKDGQQIRTFGRQEGKGWCLSTDGNDTFGGWKNQMEDECRSSIVFSVDNQTSLPIVLGAQQINSNSPARRPGSQENTWVYYDNEQRREINAEGLGRCYDIRNIDPLNWSNETLASGQRASVISLVRDDSRRPARHNNKDYVVPKGVIFTSEIIGDAEAESRFAATSFEFESEVLQEYRANVGIPKAGSAKASAAFKDVRSQTGSNSTLYAFSKMYKQYYKLDLYFDDPVHQHYVDPRFWVGVKELGQGLSAEDFIKKFGTHYASTTYYGGNFLQRRSVNKSEYAYYESSASKFKLDVEGTIKKVNFAVGTTQGSRNRNGKTETVEMSSAKIFTVGGDLDQYRPDLWSQSVLQNLAVVKARLTRLSDLLTAENFPSIPNIRAKRQLLLAAIQVAEQEAAAKQSPVQKHSFFTKKAAEFKLTVTYMKCTGHGKNEPGGNSEFFGKLTMAMVGANGKNLSSKNCFNRSDKKLLDLARNQTHDLNKSITFTVKPNDIAKGYASVYGNLKEKDFVAIPLSTVSKYDNAAKILFKEALFQTVNKTLTFTSTHGDAVVVYYKLERK